MKFIRRPQNNLLRKALFQIHLWVGIAIGLYVILIGLTGAALVFRPELQRAAFPQFFQADSGTQAAPAAQIISELKQRYPGYQLLGIDYPTDRRETYLSYLTRGGDLKTVFSSPVSGGVLGELPKKSWITVLQNLHFELLSGDKGRIANGIGAFSLILMFTTGLVIWWPGVDRWRQSLFVKLGSGWKRINWDLHSMIGFWLLGILMLWATTGVEFAFRQPFRRAVNAISPLSVFKTPESTPLVGAAARSADISGLVTKSLAFVPGAKMGRIVLPSTAKAPVLVLLAYKTHGDFDTSDEVHLYYDQYSGQLLKSRWLGDEQRTAGDSFLYWIDPLHVGNFGGAGSVGLAVKVLWMLLALSFPTLAVTGAVMWWNRIGRGYFRNLKSIADRGAK